MDNIDINPDMLKVIEDKLRTSGAWAMTRGEYVTAHYYIARNKSINTAVSLCRSSVVTLDNINLSDGVKKCLVCDLFSQSRLEVERDRIEVQEEPKPKEPEKRKVPTVRNYKQSVLTNKTKKEKNHGNN